MRNRILNVITISASLDLSIIVVKVRVKSILRIVSKHIINVRNAVLKHVTGLKSLASVVRPLNRNLLSFPLVTTANNLLASYAFIT